MSTIPCLECGRPWGTRDGSADDLRASFVQWFQPRFVSAAEVMEIAAREVVQQAEQFCREAANQ